MPPKRQLPGSILGVVLGAAGGYVAAPRTVTIPPPPPRLEGGLVCVPFGEQFPDGGFLELCSAPEVMVMGVDAGTALDAGTP